MKEDLLELLTEWFGGNWSKTKDPLYPAYNLQTKQGDMILRVQQVPQHDGIWAVIVHMDDIRLTADSPKMAVASALVEVRRRIRKLIKREW